MNSKSNNEVNHERFATDKQKRLKSNKARRHGEQQRLGQIDLDDLDSLDDLEYTGIERMK